MFSAEIYDCKALSCKIWNLTGVRVALQFQAIDDGSCKEAKSKTMPVKAIHAEIDQVHQTTMCS